jgi:2-polyprenyl-6-methoxyphenol hydroxylase-like FAD-dependent oxidoreductase
MPKRATKRGEERTALSRDCDVLICGASFAGLAIARELAGSGARVLTIAMRSASVRPRPAGSRPAG